MTAPTEDKQGNPPSLRLLDEVRNRIRTKHYSHRMEESYTHWIKRFILFDHKRHPTEMGSAEAKKGTPSAPGRSRQKIGGAIPLPGKA